MSDQGPDSGMAGSSSGIDSGLPGSDVFVERSSKSWFTRIVESIKSILIGLLLVLVSTGLMFWNEGRSAKTSAALKEGSSLVASVNADNIDPAKEGKLIHISGAASAGQPARDADFGFNANGLRLDRKVEMFQWKEESRSETQKKLGGGEETVTRYTYSKAWSDTGIDSSRFHEGNGHRNPQMPKLASHAFFSPDAKLGAFVLGDNILELLEASEPASAPDEIANRARSLLGSRARVAAGGVFAGANPDQPAVGDIRVTWLSLPQGSVSVIGAQTQSTISPFVASNGNELLLAEKGVVNAKLMFKHGADENAAITWFLRLFGVLLMFIGFRMTLDLLEVLADIVPFFGNIVGAGASFIALLATLILAPLVIALAWIVYRPLTGLLILIVGGGLAYGAHYLAKTRAAQRAPSSFMPNRG